jgi:hypothetical protein
LGIGRFYTPSTLRLLIVNAKVWAERWAIDANLVKTAHRLARIGDKLADVLGPFRRAKHLVIADFCY